MQQINHTFGEELENYNDLYLWSVTHAEQFWLTLWHSFDVIGDLNDTPILQGDTMPDSRWFEAAHLNFAENLLRFRDQRPALIAYNERGERRSYSYALLSAEVGRLSNALRDAGVQPGDRVCGYMPNIPETAIAMLATAAVGGVWSSCSPDFGVGGVVERFAQIEPRLLFTTDGYFYKQRTINLADRIEQICAEVPSIEHVVTVEFTHESQRAALQIPHVTLTQFCDGYSDNLHFTPRAFNDPLYILYSSGTTGAPKCIVHGIGGTLLQHLKEHRLHCDLRREDTLFFYTTCGWMMWNWLISGLASGATLVLYDGAPLEPDPALLWDIAEREQISVFGVSAKYLSALEQAQVKPGHSHRLPALRCILSTGSPLAPEQYEYVYRDIKADLMLSSISGGTDIISCFALGCPLLPVYASELQCRGLGMAVEVFDEQAKPLRSRKGELVCTQPFPSMPIGFWNDADGSRYRSAYFERFSGVWAHGDFAEITTHDGVIIYGRSDAVLNPGGVRIGTAEIYRQVEQLDEVAESICIGQPWHGDVRVVLFVRLTPGQTLDAELEARIRTRLRERCSPRHVPAKIIQVADIPRTLSGKIVELAVRAVVMGEAVTNREALANPEALELFRDLPQLKP